MELIKLSIAIILILISALGFTMIWFAYKRGELDKDDRFEIYFSLIFSLYFTITGIKNIEEVVQFFIQ